MCVDADVSRVGVLTSILGYFFLLSTLFNFGHIIQPYLEE